MARPKRPRCATCGRITPEAPDRLFLRRLLTLVPDDAHARVTATVAMARHVAEPTEPAAVLLLAFDVLARDLADQGHPVEVAQ